MSVSLTATPRQVLDHTQDLTRAETHRLTSIYAPPEFVKQADHKRLCGEPEEMQPHMYADQINRLYPAHTAAATWMSTLFLLDKKAHHAPADFARLEDRLTKAANFFQIQPAIKELKEKMAADEGNTLARLPDSDFALVWVGENGSKERHYPLRNRMEVKMASAWFQKHRDKFAFDDRHQIATKILDRSEKLGAAVEDREGLLKTAACGLCAAGDIATMLEKRATMVARSHPQHSTEMMALAGKVRNNTHGSRDPAIRLKMAGIVDQFDRETLLNRLYKDGLERPEEILFQVREKAASEFIDAHFTTTTGSIYEKSAMDQLSLEHIRRWMGQDFADEVSTGGMYVDTEKLAEIARTLPRNDAEMFDRMASEAQITPFAREKAASVQGMSDDERRALADAYAGSVLD